MSKIHTATPALSTRFSMLTAAALLTSGMALSPAQAQGFDAGGWWFASAALKACGGDASRLCANVVPGGGRIAMCLLSRDQNLSPSCHDFVEKAKATQGAFLACAADVPKLCGDVTPGGGRIVSCLNRQHAALSPDCARRFDEATEAFKR